ncbi:hypothetical protein ACE6H2_021832 [Prunus campanulata]
MEQTETKKAPSIAPNPSEHTYDKIYGFPKTLPYHSPCSLIPKSYDKIYVANDTCIKVDLLEPGRIVCSFKVPPRLLNGGNFMHGGAYAYPGEEVEIEAKAL